MKRLVAGVVVAGIFTASCSLPTSPIRAGFGAASVHAAPARSVGPADIVATAREYLGSPYAWIGNTPAGFSCIGFVNFVFHQNGVYVPFDIPMAWSSAPKVAESDLMPGDILFFSNTVFAGLSHVAIYIGNGQMIGADSFSVGVTTDQVNDAYWQAHYTGATRPLALLGTAPMPGTEAAAPNVPTATPVPTAVPIVASAPPGAHVEPLSNAVGMYSGPGYQYSPITTLSANATLTVVQIQGNWYDVSQGSLYGWISAADVRQVSGPSQADTKTPNSGFSRAAAISSTGTPSVLYVNQGPLYVRSTPYKGNNQIGHVMKGDRLTVIEVQSNWARVTTPNGQTGWVDTAYLGYTMPASQTDASTNGADRSTGASTVRVTASVLNVRARPDGHAPVLTVLFQGEKVRVLSRHKGWTQVMLRNGGTGWAASTWLAGA